MLNVHNLDHGNDYSFKSTHLNVREREKGCRCDLLYGWPIKTK